MAIIDKIKVGSTTYDVSPSATGTLNTTGTTKFASSDVAQGSATGWTNVDQMTTADNHATLFTKITQMAKNVRYLYNVLGTGFSTGSTVKGQIDGKAAANHSHKVAQLPTSSTQVNSNDYIPTSALIYSMNQTLTSLNDASLKVKEFYIKDGNAYFVLDSDISLKDHIVSYHPNKEFFIAFLNLNGLSSIPDPNNPDEWINGRDLYVLYYDITKDKLIPFDRTNKYNVGIYIWYIEAKK